MITSSKPAKPVWFTSLYQRSKGGLGNIVQLIGYLFCMHEAMRYKLGVVVHTCNPYTWKAKETGESEVQGHLQLCRKSEARLGYVALLYPVSKIKGWGRGQAGLSLSQPHTQLAPLLCPLPLSIPLTACYQAGWWPLLSGWQGEIETSVFSDFTVHVQPSLIA